MSAFGISARDYFAAKAMQALAAQMLVWNSEVRKSGEALTDRAKVMVGDVTETAYVLADAMLKERAK